MKISDEREAIVLKTVASLNFILSKERFGIYFAFERGDNG
jgi:hypothetical protein